MKLYNIYESIILEEITNLMQLNEAASESEIDNILNGDPNKKGKFYYVSFKYQSNNGEISNRWVQIFQRNISTANNGLIDAYQVSKNGQDSAPSNESGSLTGWKKFKLDRMSEIKVSKVPFYEAPKRYISGYKADGSPKWAAFNPNGNNSPTVQSTQKIADIGSYQYADSTIKQREYQKKKAEKEKQQRIELQKQNFANRNQAQDKEKKELQKVEFDKFKQRQQQLQQQRDLEKQQQQKQELPKDSDIENNDIENKDELNNL
jgi:hypothetical protein